MTSHALTATALPFGAADAAKTVVKEENVLWKLMVKMMMNNFCLFFSI
jgi:hypothetical protein